MPFREALYLDANATTPLDPAIRGIVAEAMDRYWANPSSVHRLGRSARVAIDDARDRLAGVLGCRPSEIVLTSGGTEANNLALFGLARSLRDRGRHIVVSAIEHPSVLAAARALADREGFTLSEIPVDGAGRVTVEALESSVRAETILVSVMAANNEIGTLQDIQTLGSWCRARGILFHCDAVQWFGKESWPGWSHFPADAVTLCGHKFFGPKGAGLLLLRAPRPVWAVQVGGAQELDRRAGTENLPAILGLAAAVERFVAPPVFVRPPLVESSARLEAFLDQLPGVTRVSPSSGRLANTVAFVVAGTDSIALLAALDLEGICASSGSACSAGSVEPSHVVRALGLPEHLAASLVRFSLLPDFTTADLARLEAVLPAVVARCRGYS